MSNQSDFFHRRLPRRAEEPLFCRPAQAAEIRPALSLILSNHGRRASEAQVVDFLRFAMQRRLNLNDLWVVERRLGSGSGTGELLWALLPVVSPGKTMLLFSPAHPEDDPAQLRAARQLVFAVCSHWTSRGVHLAQALIEPSDHASRDVYLDCSFDALAELIYLQAPTGRRAGGAVPDAEADGPLRWQSYSPQNHVAFARAIALSYEQSLDCPALNGRREIEDVIAGHKAAGDFDPSAWLLLCRGAEPLGVLLLARAKQSDVLELVYVGLTPAARGHGLGDRMMIRALRAAHERRCACLSLAVDSRNFPALKLYYRHGMQRVCSKTAMLRDLRTASVVDHAATVRASELNPSH